MKELGVWAMFGIGLGIFCAMIAIVYLLSLWTNLYDRARCERCQRDGTGGDSRAGAHSAGGSVGLGPVGGGGDYGAIGDDDAQYGAGNAEEDHGAGSFGDVEQGVANHGAGNRV